MSCSHFLPDAGLRRGALGPVASAAVVPSLPEHLGHLAELPPGARPGVAAQRHGRGVSHRRLHRIGRGPLLDQPGAEGVAQPVRRSLVELGLFVAREVSGRDRFLEPALDGLVERPAPRRAKGAAG